MKQYSFEGHVALVERDFSPTESEWIAHPKFAGVSMRRLAGAAETGGTFSLHQVRVEPGYAIETHTHPDNWEAHTVVSGRGVCTIAGRDTVYVPGVCGVMPKGVAHRVGAGNETLYILATFVPALQ